VSFTIKNYLQIEKEEDEKIIIKKDLENKLHFIMYSGYLKYNYHSRVENLPKVIANKYTKCMQDFLISTRNAAFDFIMKDSVKQYIKLMYKYAYKIVKERIRIEKYDSMKDIKRSINFIISMFEIYGGDEMGELTINIYRNLMEKCSLKDEIINCESIEEFFFASGQMAYYLLSLNKSSSKKLSILTPFLRIKSSVEMKRIVSTYMEKYSHDINFGNTKFKNLMSLIQGCVYDGQMKDFENCFINGFFTNNLIYEKKAG
jgi:CRISPR-associated protein Csh1